MYRRLSGCRSGGVGVFVKTVVIVVDTALNLEIGDPGTVEQPSERGVCPHDIVPALAPRAGVGIGVVFGVHPSEVSCDSHFETQDFGECVGVAEREPSAGVAFIRGSELFRCPGPLSAGIEHSPVLPKVETLGGGELIGPGIHRHSDVPRSAAFTCVDFHHAGVEVAVFC